MKRFYFVCVAIGLMSTAVGTGIVAAGTSATAKTDALSYQSTGLEQLKAQASPTNSTWQRPL